MVGRSGWVRLIGQGWVIWLVGGFVYVYKSRDVCELVWARSGRYGQGWSKVGRSGWVRLTGRGWVTWVVGGCGYACRSRGWCGQVWADMGKGGQRWQVWMGQTDKAGLGDIASRWVWVCVQV